MPLPTLVSDSNQEQQKVHKNFHNLLSSKECEQKGAISVTLHKSVPFVHFLTFCIPFPVYRTLNYDNK
jgi:hypothetical protein